MKTTEQPLKIGSVAAAAGVNVQTLRYYEDLRLIAKPERTDGGFRVYAPETIRRVRFIKKAQALGFSLDEIRELIALTNHAGTTCKKEVRAVIGQKLEILDHRIQQLQSMRKALSELQTSCKGSGSKTDCPILDSLGE